MTRPGSTATLLSMPPTFPPNRRRRTALLLPVALLTALAACSSDDDPTDAEPVASSADPAPAPTTAATEATEATEAGDPDAPAVAATRAMFAPITADMPGCTVAASRGGEVVFAEAVGASRLDPAVPMTVETVVDSGATS